MRSLPLTTEETGLAAQSLELQMEEAALQASRRWPRLDGTVESLEVVEQILTRGSLSDAEMQQLAAYVGETVRHLTGAGRWRITRSRLAADSGPDGALHVSGWEFDPYDFLQHLNGPLREQLDEVTKYFMSPSEATAEELGWRTVLVEPSERADPRAQSRVAVAFRWHRLRDWYLRLRRGREGGLNRAARGRG